jgi:hypothetical protein
MGAIQEGPLEKEEVFRSAFELIDEMQKICDRILEKLDSHA